MPSWADQLLLQLLMEQFDTFPIQCRHIEHTHDGVFFFFCTDSTEIFVSKLRSAGLNYNLPSLFTVSYCAGGGVSYKHCLLTFFISNTMVCPPPFLIAKIYVVDHKKYILWLTITFVVYNFVFEIQNYVLI